jgi:anti-anti-sigma regulatory factor
MQVVRDSHESLVRFTEPSLSGASIEKLLRLVGPARLRLDFAQVEDLTGNVLARLVTLHTKVRAAGGELTLENLAPAVYELFEVTHLTSVLNVRRKKAAASRSA